MEFSPETLRDAQFTERFRGYDAAEVDSFLDEAATALEELLAEASAPMAALAAERARLAIEEVRRGTLAAMEELRQEREDLESAVAELRRMLEERRRGVVDELARIDAALEEMPQVGGPGEAGACNGEGADSGADTFLARLEQAAAEGETPDAG